MQEGIFDFLKIFREGKRSPPTALRVAICIPFSQEEADRDQQSQGLGDHDGQPDAIHPQYQGQEQHGGHLEQQGTQEGDAGGDGTVAQGSEEGGAEDVEAHQQEGQGVEPQAVAGEGEQLRVIAHEQTAQEMCIRDRFREREGWKQRSSMQDMELLWYG